MELEEFIKKFQIEYQAQTFVIAVSGGVDSTVLLHKFLVFQQLHNIEIVVAHVNHQMRAQSAIEEGYLRQFCLLKSLKFECVRLDFSASKTNFQERARKLRYEFFKNICAKYKTNYLVLAHHFDDKIETTLLKISRHASLESLIGLKYINNYQGLTVLRPLLDLKKTDIKAYALAHNVRYFDDASNNENYYSRNKIRNVVVPRLQENDPDFYQTFSDLFTTLELANTHLVKRLEEISKDISYFDKGFSFSLKLVEENTHLEEELLYYIFKKYLLTAGLLGQIQKIIHSDAVTKKVVYKNLFTIIKKDDIITVYDFVFQAHEIYILIEGLGRYDLGDGRTVVVSNYDHSSANKRVFCYNSYALPIVIRSRRLGDKIKLSYGSKTIKKLIIDDKLTEVEKSELLVAVKDGELISVVGRENAISIYEIEKNIQIEVKNGSSH